MDFASLAKLHKVEMPHSRASIMAAERKFKNTFAPYVKNKELSVDACIGLLRLGYPFGQMPEEVQSAVRHEMAWRREKEKLR